MSANSTVAPAWDGLTLDQLRLFVAVAEQGSFSAAGRQLRRAQSAVSYGIANLEQLLGVKLFDRTGRRPTITAPGKNLLLDARQVLEQVGTLQARAATASHGVESDLSIVVDAIVPAELLVKICGAFHARFPMVSLRLYTEVLESVGARVLSGETQLGIASQAGAAEPGLRSTFLTQVALIPVAAAEHPLAQLPAPIATSAVRHHVQVVISQRIPADASADHGVLSAVTWRVADATTKCALIRAGLGWGNLPLTMVQEDLAAGNLVPLVLGAWGNRTRDVDLFTIVRADSPPGPAGQWLVGALPHLCAGEPEAL